MISSAFHPLRVGAALLLGCALAAAPVQAQDFDLTGEWVLTVESPNGTGTRDVTFVQEGDALKGTIASTMAVGDLTGTVDGNRVSFVALIMMESGSGFEVTYTATYVDGELKDGEVDFGDYGGGTFTGKRKEGDLRRS